MEYVHANCDGIVNLHPFNCMPGAIVNAILTKFQKDYDIPVLKVAYDGQEQSNELIRIEAFVHQCRERMESRTGLRPGRALDARSEHERRTAPAEAALSR
jgi:predicted nucleotide-binding protein (sugar kinase/HSP70/actin superfamily)